MFSASAELYDLIYSQFKDYSTETAKLAAIIRGAHPAARSVLDVACGTAEHARLLADEHGFDVDGVDLDPTFVEIARGKLARGQVVIADMTSFAIPRTYDVVQCLFSSIGYVLTLDNVRRTLECFRAHLAPQGIVLVEPWFAPGVLEPGRISIKTGESSSVHVARMSHMVIDDCVSRLRFEYLIGTADGIEHATEMHELGLFTTDEMLECFRSTGFEVTHDPTGLDGRGLFLGRVGT